MAGDLGVGMDRRSGPKFGHDARKPNTWPRNFFTSNYFTPNIRAPNDAGDDRMFDHRIRPLIDPILDRTARMAANAGLTADALTLAGCASGLLAAGAVYLGAWAVACGLFLAGRILDGLDGAVARITGATDRGGFLDIVCDFLVYAAIPLAFACNNPDANALAAATLLATFLVNGIAFLAFALMAERRKLTTVAQGRKSLYYSAGLAEGAETIAVFAVMIVWPQAFAVLAYGFAALVALSGLSRLVLGWKRLT